MPDDLRDIPTRRSSDLEERRLYQMAIDGMLDQLHDPYSVFLKRDDFRALNEATTGNYGGLGKTEYGTCSWSSMRLEEHTSELQSRLYFVCRFLLANKSL